MSKLIYITNTRLPSEKANSYQSIQMCNSFSKCFSEVELWVPILRNTDKMKKVENVYRFYGIEQTFSIKHFKTLDSKILNRTNQFLWANTKAFFFSLNILMKLLFYKNKSDSIFTRDWISLKLLAFAKKYKLIRNKVFYEAHTYSHRILNDLERIEGVIVINHHLKKLYNEQNVQNVHVSHDGVNLQTFKNIDKVDALNELNLDKDFFYLVYVGKFNTLGKEKGIPEIIKSLKYLPDNIRAIFVGGPLDNLSFYQNILHKNGLESNRVVFFDSQPVTELYKYLACADILMMPFPYSQHYAYFMSPLKMFEYMASKRVIVASKLPSIEEVLTDKKNAILCEPDNPEDLADKINWILSNDCHNIIDNAFNDVQKYTWDVRAKTIKQFMKSS